MIKTYYQMTKPGIIYGNAITAIAGFLFASNGHIKLILLIETLLGISLIIASACVFNNYIDREIDKNMARTKKRALVEGRVSNRNAIIFGVVLGIIGFLFVSIFTNKLVVIIGIIAFIDYVFIYGFYKRRSVHGTFIGGISGASSIIAGYCAVTGRLDAVAIILFIILAIWQMPHFYAIAIYRLKDYKDAGIPVMPVKNGVKSTKIQMLLYIVIFTISTISLSIYGYTGYIYLIIMLLLGLRWISLWLQGQKAKDTEKWARRMFVYSLIVLLVFSVLISINNIIA